MFHSGFEACFAPSAAEYCRKTHLKPRLWHHFEQGERCYTVCVTGQRGGDDSFALSRNLVLGMVDRRRREPACKSNGG